MNGNPKIVEASFLHRVLRIRPGFAPLWLQSRNACDGWSLPFFLVVLAVFSMFFVVSLVGWWSLLFGAPLIFVGFKVSGSFENRERWGRARRRRGDCVWCGREETPARSVCPTCDRLT